MQRSQSPPRLLSLFVALLSTLPSGRATPLASNVPFVEIANAIFAQCGTSAEGTVAAIASNGGGQWQYYTTTYVETDAVTRTSTYSSFVGGGATAAAASPTTWAPAATSAAAQCQAGNIPCGGICCAGGQYCASAGQCAAASGDFSSSAYSSYLATTSQTFSAPVRPTSGSTSTTTATSTSTEGGTMTSGPTISPIGTAGGIVTSTGVMTNNGGLSGGAIAGIVIGTIFGVALLLVLCCFGFGVAGVRTIFGGRKTRRETTYIRNSRHSHSNSGGRRTTWFGQTTGSPRPVIREKKTFGGFGPILAGLGGLALLLGLKRRHDRNKRQDYESESDYSYYDTSTTQAPIHDRGARDRRDQAIDFDGNDG
ncbi:MAG: hypothetical protein M1838_005993 [Thelocarpon superellum]|nr:MAG: hypothetical protein M1838_005993 [Thelocarpon superellum]